MRLNAILKEIKVTNSDTDSYVLIKFESNNDFDMNELNALKHKSLVVDVTESAD